MGFGRKKKDSLNSKSKSKEDDSTSVLPQASNRLDHVTKGRPKGPQGRRLPRKSHLGRASGICDSRPDNVDFIVDSDEDVRDSRGRATSLSALEASSITHPNNNKSMSSNGHGAEDKLGRAASGKENCDTWSNVSADSDMIDSQEMDLVYKYSSEEEDDSDEENRAPSNRNGRNSLTRSQNHGTTYIQKRGSGRGNSGYRGNIPSRNSSVTPPPCVLRKFRREQNGSNLQNNANNSANKTKTNNPNIDRSISPSPILLPDGDSSSTKPQRTSSGSSLSTLTADTYVSHHATLMGTQGRQHSFSSLQRKKCTGGGGSGCSTGRSVSSANASPLLGNGGCHVNGQNLRVGSGGAGSNRGSSSPYGTQSPNGTFDRNGGAAKAFHLERTMHNVSKELEIVSQETKQVESDVSGLKEDVGNMQENIAAVKGFVDATKDKVTKLQSQVGSIEKQVASIVKEAQTMREQAKKLLEMAENSKVTHDNLMEEAEHLVTFLRQATSASCVPSPYHIMQHGLARVPYQASCCSGNGSSSSAGSQYYGITNGGGGHHAPPVPGPMASLRRNKAKTPERTLDSDPEMELLDETQTQMENIIAKHRKSKALLSGSSSSGSGGSNNNHSNHAQHGLQSNRNSIIDLGDGMTNSRSMNNNNNRSPK